MKIALAAARHINRDTEYNFSQMKRFMTEAKNGGADLVCFGETFFQGFDCFDWDFEHDRKIALSTDSELFEEICETSENIGIDLLFGFAETEGESIYSSCAFISKGKLLEKYRRISRGWKEYWHTDEHYREGLSTGIFEYGGKSFSVGLCGDIWEFPERFALGEEILLWPVYISYKPEEWEGGVKTEYAEQAAKCAPKVMLINSACDDDAFGGAVFFEDGKIKSELAMGKEGILFCKI